MSDYINVDKLEDYLARGEVEAVLLWDKALSDRELELVRAAWKAGLQQGAKSVHTEGSDERG